MGVLRNITNRKSYLAFKWIWHRTYREIWEFRYKEISKSKRNRRFKRYNLFSTKIKIRIVINWITINRL